jgi:hypothetical protein
MTSFLIAINLCIHDWDSNAASVQYEGFERRIVESVGARYGLVLRRYDNWLFWPYPVEMIWKYGIFL